MLALKVVRQFAKGLAPIRCSTTGGRIAGDNALSSRQLFVEDKPINLELANGEGTEPVFMLPGALGSTQTDFGPQLTKLDASKFKLVAWDPPGYGRSRPPNREWPNNFFQRDAQHAAAVIKSEFGSATLMGWSDGGITALVLATMYPELVNKLILFGCNAYVTKQDIQLVENIRDLSKWSEKMKIPYENLYGKEHFPELWNQWIDSYSWYLHARGGDICKEQVADINKPTLIIHGQKDPLVLQEHPDYLHSRIKGSILVNWPNGKHNLHLRYFKNFNKLVTDFLLTNTVTDDYSP